MIVESAREYDAARRAACVADRAGFQAAFRELLFADVAATSEQRILDVGCGADLPRALRGLEERAPTWDGLDPSEEVLAHPHLAQRYQGCLEEVDLPADYYELAFAYNVLEHVAHPASFTRKLHETLRPGGVFWALTPHANHPFCMLSRGIELAGFKKAAADASEKREGRRFVNDYPAYYRLNRGSAARKHFAAAGFSSLAIHLFPCRQWDQYFPGPLRLFPRAYDALLGDRLRAAMLILAIRAVK